MALGGRRTNSHSSSHTNVYCHKQAQKQYLIRNIGMKYRTVLLEYIRSVSVLEERGLHWNFIREKIFLC